MTRGRRGESSDSTWFMKVDRLVYKFTLLVLKKKTLFPTAVAQCLRYCATNRKVAGSIPARVIGIFH